MLELASLMARQERYRPDATAVVFENERLTYRQFWVRVARVGNMLRALGVGPGDKVATVAGNSARLRGQRRALVGSCGVRPTSSCDTRLRSAAGSIGLGSGCAP